MCRWPINRSPFQLWWIRCHQSTFPKLVIVMPQTNVIHMGNLTMNNVSTYFKKRSKQLAKSYETKQYQKKLIHTILKGLLNERHDECAKVKINASQTKITFMSRWKSLTKVGRLTFCNEWKRWKVNVISSNGTTKNFKANTHIVRRYFSTCVAACVQHNCANGGGEKSKAIFENLRKLKPII